MSPELAAPPAPPIERPAELTAAQRAALEAVAAGKDLVPATDAPEIVPAPYPSPLIPGQRTGNDLERRPDAPLETTTETETETDDQSEPPTDDEWSEEALAQKLKAQAVDISHGVISKSIDYGDKVVAEKIQKSGFLKRIWTNITRDVTHQRAEQRGRKQIVAEGNLDVLNGGTLAEHEASSEAIVNRFTSEYDLLHKSTGEANGDLEATEPGQQLAGQIKDLIKQFAAGNIDEDVLTAEKGRLLHNYGQDVHKKDRNKGLLYADNIVDVAKNAKAAFAHYGGLDEIDKALNTPGTIMMGEARVGVRTEAHYGATDKVLDKLHKTGVGLLVNESTIGVTTAAAMVFGKFASRKALSAFTKFATVGASAGIVAGLRENLHVKQERRQHMREMAEGGQPDEIVGKRRERLEATRYETKHVDILSRNLDTALGEIDTSPDKLQAALSAISETAARIKLSDENAIDLIQYNGTTSVETDRLNLDIRLAQTKVALKNQLAGLDDAGLEAAGFTTRDVDELVGNRVGTLIDAANGDISSKDQAFNKYRREQVLKAAAIGMVGGMAVGEVLQNARALVSNELQAIYEKNGPGESHRTLVAGIFGHGSPNTSVGEQVPVNAHTLVDVPKGYNLGQQNGHWELSHGNTTVDVGFNADGHLTAASQQALAEHNLIFNQTSSGTHATVTHETVTRTPEEYLKEHPNKFTNITRTWEDNDTPQFDHNELRLDWGNNGTGIDAKGNYEFNVAGMSPDGSWHEGVHVNAQDGIHNGTMKIALSMTEGTQTHVALVDVDAQGNAHVDPNSFLGRSLFEDQGGHAKFDGAYAEAVLVSNPVGGEAQAHVLATVVGESQPKLASESITHVIPGNERVTTVIQEGPRGGKPIEIPPVFPLYARRGLDALRRKAAAEGEPDPLLDVPRIEDLERTWNEPPAIPAPRAVPPLERPATPTPPSVPPLERRPGVRELEDIVDAEIIDDEKPVLLPPDRFPVRFGDWLADYFTRQNQLAIEGPKAIEGPIARPAIAANRRPELEAAERDRRPALEAAEDDEQAQVQLAQQPQQQSQQSDDSDDDSELKGLNQSVRSILEGKIDDVKTAFRVWEDQWERVNYDDPDQVENFLKMTESVINANVDYYQQYQARDVPVYRQDRLSRLSPKTRNDFVKELNNSGIFVEWTQQGKVKIKSAARFLTNQETNRNTANRPDVVAQV